MTQGKGSEKTTINHSSNFSNNHSKLSNRIHTPSDEIHWTGDAKMDELSFYHIREKLKSYERIQIENLLQELTNKTHLIENLIQEKRAAEKKFGTMKDATASTRKKDFKRPVSPHRRFPDLRWNISFDASQGNTTAGAAEPESMCGLDAQEFASKLMAQNQGLQRLLQSHQIEIPKELQGGEKLGKVAFTIPGTPTGEQRTGSARSLSTRRPVSALPTTGTPFVIPQLSKSRPDSGIASQRTSALGTPRPGTADLHRIHSRPTSSRVRDLQWPRPPRRPESGFSERPTSARPLPRLES
jgi:hypothetical protein